MKLYSLYTPSHKSLKDDWFLPSIKDDYEIDLSFIDIESGGNYMEKDWLAAILRKIDIIIKAIKENKGGLFVFSDVDIQFFAPTEPILVRLIKDNDILFQNDHMSYSYRTHANSGFFICRANNKTMRFWKGARKLCAHNKKMDDQGAVNSLLQKASIGMLWEYLPDEFYCPGRKWKPGDNLDIPTGIVMHHANWVVGVENKIAQLRYVRNKLGLSG